MIGIRWGGLSRLKVLAFLIHVTFSSGNTGSDMFGGDLMDAGPTEKMAAINRFHEGLDRRTSTSSM